MSPRLPACAIGMRNGADRLFVGIVGVAKLAHHEHVVTRASFLAASAQPVRAGRAGLRDNSKLFRRGV